MVNLELYRIFIIVAKNKSITRASNELGISQPAVTKHIKNLEDGLNIQLLVRKNNGIELTKEGQDLYNKINDATNILIKIEDEYISNRVIHLGCHSTMLDKLFSFCLVKYYEENINNKILVSSNDTKEMFNKLENKELDIVLSKKVNFIYNKEKIIFHKISILNDILVSTYNSKLANKTISLQNLKDIVFYMPRETSSTTINFLKSINCDSKSFKNVKNITYNTMVKLIKSNENSIGLVTKEYIEEELKNKELITLSTEFDIPKLEFGIYLNKDNQFKELNKLVKIIKQNYKI